MSNMLRPADIATLIQEGSGTWGGLNDKAIELYDSGEITDKVVFYVTADFQLYERLQKAEYEVDDYQKFTPVIIGRINHYEYPADYVRYEESYTIGIHGYADQLESLEKIIKAWTVDENTTNKSIVESTFRITKEVQDVSFALDIEPMDGSLDKRVNGTGSFTWTFLDGIMTSYDTTISIDGEEMPYLSFDWTRAINPIISQSMDATGSVLNTINAKPFVSTLVLPYISTSTIIKGLYEELLSNNYNKTHTLSYTDTALGVTHSYNVRISSGSISDTQPRVLDFVITFERVLPTVTLTIDAVEVPLLGFSMNSGSEVSTSIQINSEASENAYLGNVYQLDITLDLSDVTNAKTQALLDAVLNQTFDTPHTIVLTKGAITGTYNVLLRNGSYTFDTNPLDRLNLSFVKLDSNV